MVRHISDRIGVMYAGRLVEVADSDELYDNPLHPYTRALLSSILETDPRKGSQRIRLEGYSRASGADAQAVLREVSPGHYVAVD
ncbi:Oligopeptide transport ATP-binding protein OppF [compost metagenome]